MRIKNLYTAAALAACFGMAAAVQADENRKTPGDREFVNDAANGGMAEIKLGELAQTQAASPEVRKLGEKIADDHTRANKQLVNLLKVKGMTSPSSELSKKSQETYDRLARLKGAEFDRAYLKDMVEDHRQDIAMFESFAKNGQDADLRSFAIKTLPTLREHYKMAREITGETKDR